MSLVFGVVYHFSNDYHPKLETLPPKKIRPIGRTFKHKIGKQTVSYVASQVSSLVRGHSLTIIIFFEKEFINFFPGFVCICSPKKRMTLPYYDVLTLTFAIFWNFVLLSNIDGDFSLGTMM